jgi:hypothetical protein
MKGSMGKGKPHGGAKVHDPGGATTSKLGKKGKKGKKSS